MHYSLLLVLLLVCSTITAQTTLTWGDIDTRYPQDTIIGTHTRSLHLRAWRGERVNAQALLRTTLPDSVTITHTALRSRRATLPDSLITPHLVRYVWTDELSKDRTTGCGLRPNRAEWDSSLVADRLDPYHSTPIAIDGTQPLWFTIDIPRDATPGRYNATIQVHSTAQPRHATTLTLTIEVLEQTLPLPSEWHFHLDLWQNPYAVARYHNVPLWSDEHFALMRPLFSMLAAVGQRSITTSIMHHPWNAQTFDPYDSMIGRTRHIDGTWSYDYTVFDRYVEFMMHEVGITDMISCYTMIPWALQFDYYDQATSRIQYVQATPGEQAYTDYWLPFLRDFAQHLRAKGWFNKTAISMDERPMPLMREAIKVIRQADPDFKITLAGGYHPELLDDLYYLSIPYGQRYPDEVKRQRDARGQISTVYTCCSETFPNSFTFSSPAESAWTVLHALAAGYDGWLRWAVNSWTEDPLHDSRFWSWAAGDTYSLYPDARSSIRFERLREGLQDCEKVHQLRQTLSERELQQLQAALNEFVPVDNQRSSQPSPTQATLQVRQLHNLLNTLHLPVGRQGR